MAKIHENIRKYRLLREMTLEELGKKVGTTKATIQRYEIGEISNIPYDKVEALANALGISPGVLMGWDEPPVDYFLDSEIVTCVQNLNGSNVERLLAYAKKLLELQSMEDE